MAIMSEQTEREMQFEDLLMELQRNLRSVLEGGFVREESVERYYNVLKDTERRIDECLREE